MAEPAGDALDSTAEGGDPRLGWRAFAMPLVAVAAASGLMESGTSSLLPSISMRLGFALDTAAWLGAFVGAGSALMQAPFGALADRIGLRRAMALAWTLVLGATLSLWWWAGAPQQVLWPVGFVLGGVGGAVYTLVVIELGTGWWAAAWSRQWGCWSPPTRRAPRAGRRWAGGCSTGPGCRGGGSDDVVRLGGCRVGLAGVAFTLRPPSPSRARSLHSAIPPRMLPFSPSSRKP